MLLIDPAARGRACSPGLVLCGGGVQCPDVPVAHRVEDVGEQLAGRGPQARNIAKVAAARKLLTCVFYAMRDGHVRSLAARSRAAEAG